MELNKIRAGQRVLITGGQYEGCKGVTVRPYNPDSLRGRDSAWDIRLEDGDTEPVYVRHLQNNATSLKQLLEATEK